MSDVFLSAGVSVDMALVARGMAFTDYTRVETGTVAGVNWAVSRVDNYDLWGPAWDPVSQTRVLLGGRIALEEVDWAAAERLPYQGGLAARHILASWLTRGARGVSGYNGAALVVVLDERQHEAHLWTDRMGFFPVFAWEGEGVIVASHPDLIAHLWAAAGQPLEIDETTIAEFLHTGSPFHTHSYWRGVRHLDAASQYQVGAFDKEVRLRPRGQYWRPAFLDGAPPLPRAAFVESFADAFRAAGRRRSLDRLGPIAVLLSAGADSRGILAATKSPSEVYSYTYFDEPNPELEGAKRIASLAGSRHISLQRTTDYYVRNAEETVRLSGGMWGIDGGHHTGFARAIRDTSHPGTLLTGEFCDLLFKGVALNRREMLLFGRCLPLFELSAYSHEHYLPFGPIAPEWAGKVAERLDAGVPCAVQTDPDPRKAEFARLSPLSRYGAASSILTLWRTTPLDVFVADNEILDAYGLMSVADKLSGIAFGQAIARVTGAKIAAVPNNNFGAPVGTNEAERVTAFLLASAARKLSAALVPPRPENPKSVATPGSWPSQVKVALNSAVMRQWFDDLRKRDDGRLRPYLHPSRRDWTYEEYATGDIFQFCRLITVDIWLRQNAGFAAHS